MTENTLSDIEQETAVEVEYFYTTNYPHRWSSGADITTLDPDNGWAPIASLARAKELAESKSVKSYGENRCDTTYGVQYKVTD